MMISFLLHFCLYFSQLPHNCSAICSLALDQTDSVLKDKSGRKLLALGTSAQAYHSEPSTLQLPYGLPPFSLDHIVK